MRPKRLANIAAFRQSAIAPVCTEVLIVLS